jgi:hypothetical protein
MTERQTNIKVDLKDCREDIFVIKDRVAQALADNDHEELASEFCDMCDMADEPGDCVEIRKIASDYVIIVN